MILNPKIVGDLTPNSVASVHLALDRIGVKAEPCVAYILHAALDGVASISSRFTSQQSQFEALRHTNIGLCYGEASIENRPALVVEYLDGVDLRTIQHLSAKTKFSLSLPMAMYIVAELTKALVFLHGQKDQRLSLPVFVKCFLPSSIIVTTKGEVRVFSHLLGGATEEIIAAFPEKSYADSRRYLAPELIAGAKASVGTELFSLGVIFWELINRRRYSGDSSCSADTPIYVCDFVSSLLASNTDLRPQDAHSVERKLRELLHENYPKFSVGHLEKFVSSTFSRELNFEADVLRKGMANFEYWTDGGSNATRSKSGTPESGDSFAPYQKGRTLNLDVVQPTGELSLKGAPEKKSDKTWNEITVEPDLVQPSASRSAVQISNPEPQGYRHGLLWVFFFIIIGALVAAFKLIA